MWFFFEAKTQLDDEEVEKIMDSQQKKKNDGIISQHIFMFPFRFKGEYSLGELKKKAESEGWVHKPFDFKFGEPDARARYNEYVYFHEYVRRAIFSDGRDDISMYFERKEGISEDDRFTLYIKGRDKPYILTIHHISLRLFDTNIGILTVEVLNYDYDYPDIEDILKINDFGRRIYPQFIDEERGIDGTKGAFLAKKIEFHFNGNPIEELFSEKDFLHKELRIAEYIKFLLGENIVSDIVPIIDDRMFVVCWYGDNDFSNCLKHKYKFSPEWYSLIFVDGSPGGGIDNQEMMEGLIEKATYSRWAELGTFYGISRYSLVSVTDREDYGYKIVRNHMQRMYYQMALILLAQRASILRFSAEVACLSGKIKSFAEDGDGKKTEEDFWKIAKKVKKLHASYIRFVNRLWFTEVTPQEQGIEMFEMAQKTMGLKEQIEELKAEIRELYEFVEMQYEKEKAEEDRKATNKLNMLNVLAFIFLPITVLAGIWGMNLYFINHLFPSSFLEWTLNFGASFVIFTLSFMIIYSYTERIFQKIQESELEDAKEFMSFRTHWDIVREKKVLKWILILIVVYLLLFSYKIGILKIEEMSKWLQAMLKKG